MEELAHLMEKDSVKMVKAQENNAWWLCSKQCIAVFVGIPVALFLIILIATWAICGSPFCMGDD